MLRGKINKVFRYQIDDIKLCPEEWHSNKFYELDHPLTIKPESPLTHGPPVAKPFTEILNIAINSYDSARFLLNIQTIERL